MWHVRERAITGKPCPVCRSNPYARERAAWESEPKGTRRLTIRTRQFTQAELIRIAAAFPQLEELSVLQEKEQEKSSDGKEVEPAADDGIDISAAAVALPALMRLSLVGARLKRIPRITLPNAPLLESLSLDGVNICVKVFHDRVAGLLDT
jgi:hypothetical protein